MREPKPSQPFYNITLFLMITILALMIVQLSQRIDFLEAAYLSIPETPTPPAEYGIYLGAAALFVLALRELFRGVK